MNLKPNIVAECDSLDLLERMESSCVDLIYLDPPWFSNNQKILDEFKEYKSFISKVLTQCVRVLNDTGNLFLYTRPDLTPDFSWMLRELLGGDNYVSEYVLPIKRFGISQGTTTHETVLHFRKTENAVYNTLYNNSLETISKLFSMEDERGRYTYLSPFRRESASVPRFPWNNIWPKEGMTWRYSLDKLEELQKDGLIVQKDTVYIKKYYTSEDQLVPVGTLWDDIPREYKRPGEQSVKLLERIIRIGSNNDAVILDPFCGSGPTGEACINLERKFILCDNNKDAIEHTSQRIDGVSKALYRRLNPKEINDIEIVFNDYTKNTPDIENEILSIISAGESEKVEFKVAACWNEAKEKKDSEMANNILKCVAGFANTEGGHLFIGINDNSEIIGLQKDFETANPQKKNSDGYELYLHGKIRASLGPEFIMVYSIEFHEIAAKTVCEIEVRPSTIPIFLDKVFYCRNGNSTIKLEAADFYAYMKSRDCK